MPSDPMGLVCSDCGRPMPDHDASFRRPWSCLYLLRAQLAALRSAAEPFVRVAERGPTGFFIGGTGMPEFKEYCWLAEAVRGAK